MSDTVLKTKWLVIGDRAPMSVQIDPRESIEKLKEAAFSQRERQFLTAGITDATEFDLYTQESNTPLEVDAAISDMGTQGDSAKQPLRVQSRVARTPLSPQQQQQQQQPARPVYTIDGIEPDDSLLLQRSRLVDEVLNKGRVVIIRSPPATGKTSLLQLVSHRLSAMGKPWRYITFAEKRSEQSARDFFLSQLGTTDDKVASLDMHVLLDEAQREYADDKFWVWLLKGIVARPGPLKLVIAASYPLTAAAQGSPVAMGAYPTVDYSALKMTQEEADELYDKAVIAFRTIPALNSPQLRSVIQRSCGGHIGCLRLSIQGVCSRKLNDEKESIRYFLCAEFLAYLDRCFSTIEAFELTQAQRTLLQAMFIEGDQSIDLGNLEQRQLVRSAIIEKHDINQYGFTAPIVKRYIFRRVFPGRLYPDEIKSHDIDDLILQTVTQFSPNLLRQARQGSAATAGVPFPKEAALQQLFYKGFSECAPVNVSIVPEMSSIFASDDDRGGQSVAGELDFYIDSKLQWGIELVRQGTAISEHLKRFAPKGKYAALELKEYRVVDFRPSSKAVRTPAENLVIVSFDEEFLGAEIRFNKADGRCETRNVQLLG